MWVITREEWDCAILWLSMPSLEPIFDFVFTDHALIEMARREITREDVRDVLANPEQREIEKYWR